MKRRVCFGFGLMLIAAVCFMLARNDEDDELDIRRAAGESDYERVGA